MAAVNTDNQVYLFYQAPHQSNTDFMKYFRAQQKKSIHTMVLWDIIQD